MQRRVYETEITQYIKQHPQLTAQQVAIAMQLPYHLILEVYVRSKKARIFWDILEDKESYKIGFINTADEGDDN